MATQCLALFEARASLRSCSATSDATAFPMLRSRSSFVAREAPLHPIKSFIFSIYKTSPEGRESPAEFAPADDSPVTPMIPSYTQNPGGVFSPPRLLEKSGDKTVPCGRELPTALSVSAPTFSFRHAAALISFCNNSFLFFHLRPFTTHSSFRHMRVTTSFHSLVTMSPIHYEP